MLVPSVALPPDTMRTYDPWARVVSCVDPWLGAVMSACVVLTALSGCSRDSESHQTAPPGAAKSANASSPADVTKSPVKSMGVATVLLEAAGSPYAATLAADTDGIYLLMQNAAYWLVPGRAPQRWKLPLGISPTLMDDLIVFWSEGSLWQAHKRGGDPTVLAEVSHQPQRIVAHGGRLAWLDHAKETDGRYTIHTLKRSKARLVCAPVGYVATLAMGEDQVYFAERAKDRSWRLGAVGLSGGTPRYTEPKKGRTPAMLAVAQGVFYYDGPSSTVRRLSPDLQQEKVVARKVICSPIAVAEHIYCAQPAGILELGRDGVVRRMLPSDPPGAITAMAVTNNRLAWLMDVGQEHLAVKSLDVASGADPSP